MEPAKTKKCKVCGAEFRPFKSTERFCSFACAKEHSTHTRTRKPVKPISDKHRRRLSQYSKQRKEYLARPENRWCFIDGCGSRATTIEHTKGREGYADDQARQEGTWLLNDERWWKPCCLKHNLELENNPELARRYQTSKLHQGNRGT